MTKEVKISDVAISPGVLEATRVWKRQGAHSPLGPLREHIPAIVG